MPETENQTPPPPADEKPPAKDRLPILASLPNLRLPGTDEIRAHGSQIVTQIRQSTARITAPIMAFVRDPFAAIPSREDFAKLLEEKIVPMGKRFKKYQDANKVVASSIELCQDAIAEALKSEEEGREIAGYLIETLKGNSIFTGEQTSLAHFTVPMNGLGDIGAKWGGQLGADIIRAQREIIDAKGVQHGPLFLKSIKDARVMAGSSSEAAIAAYEVISESLHGRTANGDPTIKLQPRGLKSEKEAYSLDVGLNTLREIAAKHFELRAKIRFDIRQAFADSAIFSKEDVERASKHTGSTLAADIRRDAELAINAIATASEVQELEGVNDLLALNDLFKESGVTRFTQESLANATRELSARIFVVHEILEHFRTQDQKAIEEYRMTADRIDASGLLGNTKLRAIFDKVEGVYNANRDTDAQIAALRAQKADRVSKLEAEFAVPVLEKQ